MQETIDLLLLKLDMFQLLHANGENPSPSEIRELFALKDAIKAERQPIVSIAPAPRLVRDVAADEYDQRSERELRADARRKSRAA